MKSVSAEIKSAIRRRSGEGFIFVVGPTRIGKTTVFEYIVHSLLEEAMDEMQKDLGCLPVAGMEAGVYHRGYDWKDHWVGCLEALNEPLIQYKSARADPDFTVGKESRAFINESRSTTVLRRSFEKAAVHRKLRVFCLDEAHHLTLVPLAKMHRAQLEIIKSVASKSRAIHILFGTYDLLKLRNANGQLGSRAVTIHFNRYGPDNKIDQRDFADVLLSLVAHMPLVESPDLKKHLDYCFEVSLGCIGLLKVWFTDALASVLEGGRKTLSRDDLEKYEPPIDVLEKISSEIVDGERKLEQDEKIRSLIRSRMLNGSKYKEPGIPSQSQSTQQAEVLNNIPASQASTLPHKRGKRIERNPKRDKVGVGRKGRAA